MEVSCRAKSQSSGVGAGPERSACSRVYGSTVATYSSKPVVARSMNSRWKATYLRHPGRDDDLPASADKVRAVYKKA